MVTEQRGNIGYTISGNELLFLGAATGAEVFYGIPAGLPLSETEMQDAWQLVRESLLAKELASERDGKLVVGDGLSNLVQIAAEPKLFMVCTNRVGGHDTARNYYCADRQVVRLQPTGISPDGYYLTGFDSPENLSFELETFMAPPEVGYEPESQRAVLSADVFQQIVDAVAVNDRSACRELLVSASFSEDAFSDFFRALTDRKTLSTIVTVKIEKDGNMVRDFLLFTASRRLWQAEVHAEKAKISQISLDDFQRKVELMAALCYYI